MKSTSCYFVVSAAAGEEQGLAKIQHIHRRDPAELKNPVADGKTVPVSGDAATVQLGLLMVRADLRQDDIPVLEAELSLCGGTDIGVRLGLGPFAPVVDAVVRKAFPLEETLFRIYSSEAASGAPERVAG